MHGQSGPARGEGPSIDLNGVTVLIVDDDVPNVFALTSVVEVDTIEVIEDLDLLSESNRCSCSAGDDQPY